MSWPVKPLGKVADLCLGKMLDQKKNKGDLLPYLANVNVRWGAFDLTDLRHMKFEAHELDRYGIKYGDIVMCEGGEPGRCAIWKEQAQGMMIQKALHRIRPHNCLNYIFLYYQFLHIGRSGEFSKLFTGATIKHLPNQNLAKLEVSIPPLQIQQKIADILSAYDDLIENNRRRIQLLEESARQLYKEWFVRLRFPGHEHVKVVDGVPEGWERRSAWDIVQILSGGTPKTNTADYWNGDIPFFTPKDAVDTAYAFVTEKTLTETGLKNCASQLFDKDTIFITARGTVGKVNLAQTKMAMNQSCYALKILPPLNQLIGYFALTEEVRQIKAKAVGSVFDAIIKDTFKHIILLVPACGVIEQFTEYASDILRQIDILSTQNRKLAQARDLLLPKLMSGEVAV